MDDMLALSLAYGLLIALLLGHSILTAFRMKDLDERLKAAIESMDSASKVREGSSFSEE